MAATVLNSPRAVEVSIYVVRAFVQLRELLAGQKELATRLKELETRVERKLMTQDQAIAGILDAIRQTHPNLPLSLDRRSARSRNSWKRSRAGSSNGWTSQ